MFARDRPFVVFSLFSRVSNVRPAIVHMRTYRPVLACPKTDTVPSMATCVATSNLGDNCRFRGSCRGPWQAGGDAGSVEHDHGDEGFGGVEAAGVVRSRPIAALLDSTMPFVSRHSMVPSIEAR